MIRLTWYLVYYRFSYPVISRNPSMGAKQTNLTSSKKCCAALQRPDFFLILMRSVSQNYISHHYSCVLGGN